MTSPARRTPYELALPPLDEILSRQERADVSALGITGLEDMLRRPPRRWAEPEPLRKIAALSEGDDVSALVTVESFREHAMRKRSGVLLDVRVTDGTDTISLPFFLRHSGQVNWHRERLRVGRRIVVFGTVSVRTVRGHSQRQIVHPQYEVLDEAHDVQWAMRPRPVYPLRGKKATQAKMRSAYEKALTLVDTLPSVIPEELRAARHLHSLPDALRAIHAPRTMADVHRGLRHLAFEEALVLQAIFADRRLQDARTPAPSLTSCGPLRQGLGERLPFPLTDGQHAAIDALDAALVRSHPSSTLLQGDVGSGKTVVALHAMLAAVDAGHQAVLLAPTDVLARQHYATITELLGPLGRAGQLDAAPHATAVRLLTGSLTTAERRRALLDITTAEAGLVVGTHAVLEDRVEFFSLGLAVIDEQHRFGVDHRRRLRAKGPEGTTPHTLVMTATPIPRTAALAIAGDLDILNLTEVPAQRAGLTSYAVPEKLPAWEQRMWKRTAEEIASGRQAFVVCSRIDANDDAPTAAGMPEDDAAPEPRSVHEVAEHLAGRPELAGMRIGVLHGRMSAEEKTAVMADMTRGDIDLLVSTTVIEVGIDVPNASVMIVLDAERFGISQLHQLRGRVGRGEHPGIAFFATRSAPDSETVTRLTHIAQTTDGFALAELDLRTRGSGNLVGDEQSGLVRTLRHLDVLRHADLIADAREDAQQIIARDPDLLGHPDLARAVAQRLADADPDVERS